MVLVVVQSYRSTLIAWRFSAIISKRNFLTSGSFTGIFPGVFLISQVSSLNDPDGV